MRSVIVGTRTSASAIAAAISSGDNGVVVGVQADVEELLHPRLDRLGQTACDHDAGAG